MIIDINGCEVQTIDSVSALDPLMIAFAPCELRFKPTSGWPSCLFRACYLVLLLGVWFISLLYTAPAITGSSARRTTSFLVELFYLVFLTVSIAVFAYYLIYGRTTTTMIPCISSTWYRLYTLVITALWLHLASLLVLRPTDTPVACTPVLLSMEAWSDVLPYSFFGSSDLEIQLSLDSRPRQIIPWWRNTSTGRLRLKATHKVNLGCIISVAIMLGFLYSLIISYNSGIPRFILQERGSTGWIERGGSQSSREAWDSCSVDDI